MDIDNDLLKINMLLSEAAQSSVELDTYNHRCRQVEGHGEVSEEINCC